MPPRRSSSRTSEDHVKVVVRFRPSPSLVWNLQKHDVTLAKENFTAKYDHVFSPATSTHDLYSTTLQPLVTDFVNGISCCVFAYGQTGSGKTHTIFGSSTSGSLDGVLPLALQEIVSTTQKRSPGVRTALSISLFEIYCESVTDLLEPSSSALSIRECSGSFFVEGLSSRLVASPEAAQDILQYGMANRSIGHSYIHDRSSRAHSVCRVVLATEKRVKGVNECCISEFYFVDLAGSESMTYNFGEKQREETKAINLSLFSLRCVITMLATKEAHIPYRNSALTKALHPALGRNCKTVVLCLCHGGEEHIPFTKGTLHFGDVSRSIELKATVNKISKSNKGPTTKPIEENVLSVEKPDLTALPPMPAMEKISIATRQGPTICHVFRGESDKPVVLCLQAYGAGCCGRDWEYLFPYAASVGWTVIAPDMPGFGETPGNRHTSRSERMLDKSGPIELLDDVLLGVMGTKKLQNLAVVGWDWGGNMAFHLALRNQPQIKCLGLFHPNWTDKVELLSGVKIPTLMCWVPGDQFHSIVHGKKMGSYLPKGKLLSLKCPPQRVQQSGDQVLQQVAREIFQFFMANLQTKTVPSASLKEPEHSESSDDENEGLDDDDDQFSRNSSFLALLVTDPVMRLEHRHPSENKIKLPKVVLEGPIVVSGKGPEWAVEQIRQLKLKNQLFALQQAYLPGGGSNRPQAASIFGALPIVTPLKVTWNEMQQWGIWPILPLGLDILKSMNRYPCGRQIWVRTTIDFNMKSSTFGRYDRQGVEGLTMATIVSSSKDDVSVQMRTVTGDVTQLSFGWKSVLDLNEPNYYQNVGDNFVLEDGITLRPKDFLTKAKIIECGIVISQLVSEMNFQAAMLSAEEGSRLLDLQMMCVKEIRKCMNMIHHVQKGKDPSRMCVPDVGKLATYGQWHCHGMASVEAALLYPFAHLLGLELRIVDGFFACTDGRDALETWNGHPRPICDHMWLEVAFFPSCYRCVVDASFDEYEGYLVPLSHAYSVTGKRFPVRTLKTATANPTNHKPFITGVNPMFDASGIQINWDKFAPKT